MGSSTCVMASPPVSPLYVSALWHWDEKNIVWASVQKESGRSQSTRLGTLTSINYQSAFNLGEKEGKVEVYKIGVNDGLNIMTTPTFAFRCSLVVRSKMPANLRALLPHDDAETPATTAKKNRDFASK